MMHGQPIIKTKISVLSEIHTRLLLNTCYATVLICSV